MNNDEFRRREKEYEEKCFCEEKASIELLEEKLAKLPKGNTYSAFKIADMMFGCYSSFFVVNLMRRLCSIKVIKCISSDGTWLQDEIYEII